MYLNFGEIGQNIKTLMTEFQQNVKSNQRLESIADMKVTYCLPMYTYCVIPRFTVTEALPHPPPITSHPPKKRVLDTQEICFLKSILKSNLMPDRCFMQAIYCKLNIVLQIERCFSVQM